MADLGVKPRNQYAHYLDDDSPFAFSIPFMVCRVTRQRRWLTLLGAIGSILMAGLFFVSSLPENRLLGFAMMFVFLSISVWSFITYLREKHFAIEVHRDGLIQRTHKRVETVRWDEIRSVRAGVLVNWAARETHYKLLIYTRSGQTVTIDTTNRILREIGFIHNRVQREVTARLLPRVLSAFRAGRTLDFGSLLVNRQGLRFGEKKISWPEIKAIDLKQGLIRIKKRTGLRNWVNISADNLPNAFVFLGLTDQVLHAGEFAEIRRPQ